MDFFNTIRPYDVIERDDIQYTYCHNYSHVSRYRGLRQVVHQGISGKRYVALETPNSYNMSNDVNYYIVSADRENRLDLIARDFLGSASYKWVIAYYNDIEDGFSCPEGTKLAIPKTITSLMETGQILSPVPATKLNLGSE